MWYDGKRSPVAVKRQKPNMSIAVLEVMPVGKEDKGEEYRITSNQQRFGILG